MTCTTLACFMLDFFSYSHVSVFWLSGLSPFFCLFFSFFAVDFALWNGAGDTDVNGNRHGSGLLFVLFCFS